MMTIIQIPFIELAIIQGKSNRMVLTYIFWISMGLCVASYVAYPIIIYLVGKITNFSVIKSEITPRISIIISAFNEGKDIRNKLLNTLSLDYPSESFEILVGSDGSTDNTAKFVREFESQGVHLYDFTENRGKTAVQNDLVQHSNYDVLVFTDAASFLPADALKKIVANFADERVGCVAGRMRFVDTDKNITTHSQGMYWKYEVMLRQLESDIGSLIGVDGPLYAIRKDYYVPLERDIISDLMTPLHVLGKKKRVVLEPEAYVDEEPKEKSDQEYNTRRRVVLRGMVGIFSYPALLNPFVYPMVSFQILLHKIIRWNVGLLILINFFACVLLAGQSGFFYYFLLAYALFVCLALVGWIGSVAGVSIKLLSVPYYFMLVNLAATMAVIDFLRGKKAVTWDTVR